MTHDAPILPTEPSEHPLSAAEVANFISQEQTNRRGGFAPRAVFVQKLNEFGSPGLAVLTFEQDTQLTIAGLLNVVMDDDVIIYDDLAPQGAQFFHGTVTEVREAHRPADVVRGMKLIYINKINNIDEQKKPEHP